MTKAEIYPSSDLQKRDYWIIRSKLDMYQRFIWIIP